MNINRTLRMISRRVNDIDFDADSVLHSIGLARRRPVVVTVLPSIGFLLLGAMIGAGVGLALAPASGRRTRQNVEDKINALKQKYVSGNAKRQESISQG